MTITNARAIYALFANATPTRVNVGTQQTIGESATQTPYTGVEGAYSVGFVISAGSSGVVDLADNDTAASTSWTAGVAQVETATVTAAAGITTSGNATVTVTAAGMTGSPKAISVPLTTAAHTTATLIATAIAAGLNADADYSALFTATTSTNTVITTRKPTSTVVGGLATYSFYAANDGTLNVALANGTCVGITTAATSANTTSGVLTAGVTVESGGTEDFEGNTITAMTKINGLLIQVVSGTDVTVTSAGNRIAADPLAAGCNILCDFGDTGLNSDVLTIAATTDPAYVTVTVLGYTV